MTRTSKRWIVQCLTGIVGAVALGEPAMAEGWFRIRPKTPCEASCAPCAQPATPPTAPQMLPSPVTPKTETPKTEAPKVEPKDVTPPPKVDAPAAQPVEPRFEPLISAALGESALAVAFQPAMFGDINGRGTSPVIVIVNPITGLVTTVPTSTTVPGRPNQPQQPGQPVQPTQAQTQQRVIVQLPQLSYAAFKISENESPRPTDRVFATYNYYNNLPTSSFTPGFDVHRETVGFEKTFFDGSASIGVRVPFLQLSGAEQVLSAFNISDGQFGDVSVIGKYAFYDDRSTGNLLSGGLMITAPTGQSNYVVNGNRIHSTLLQPWTGGIWGLSDNLFVHGFSSIVIPTEGADVTAWYNDLGLGYWLRKGRTDRFFHGIVPTAEVHVGTPLTNRGDNNVNQVHISDYCSIVGGVNFVFWRNSTLGFAAGAPVVGPKPWDMEGHVSVNFRF